MAERTTPIGQPQHGQKFTVSFGLTKRSVDLRLGLNEPFFRLLKLRLCALFMCILTACEARPAVGALNSLSHFGHFAVSIPQLWLFLGKCQASSCDFLSKEAEGR